ncbi:MAG: chemotaxis protein CheW [Sporichthyaceae bacterium]
MRALLLGGGPDRWCLPLDCVREVFALPPVTPLPHGAPALRGLFNLRGDVLALFGLPELLGRDADRATHAVLVELPAGRVAVTSSATPRNLVLADSLATPEHPAGRGTYAVGPGEIAVLLDPARLFAGVS